MVNLLKNIEIPEIRSCSGKGVKVAVIDSGIDLKSHLIKNVKKSIGIGYKNDKIFHYRNVNDENGHGTKICNIILSIAPDVELYIAKIFEIRLVTEMDCLVKGIEWAINNKVNIINVSLGTTSTRDIKGLRRACDLAIKNGITIVSSLDNKNRISYPGWFRDVFCVYNKEYARIKKNKKYLLTLRNGCKIYPNSYLVPVVSAYSSLTYEGNSKMSPENICHKLKTLFKNIT